MNWSSLWQDCACHVLATIVMMTKVYACIELQSYSNPQKQEILRGGKCLKTPELKLLCLSLFYIIWGVIILARFGESAAIYDSRIQDSIDFALCHLGGESGSLDCPSHDSLTDTKGLALDCLSYFLLGCLPVSSLVFALTSSDLERVVECWKRVVKPSETSKMDLSASGGTKNGDSQRMPSAAEELPRNL